MAKQAIVRLAIAFAALLFAARLHAETVSYTFKYTPEGNKPTSVHVAGEFNNWSASANPMADADGDGTWEATLELGEGHHSYKFVINSTEWINDPKADPDLAMEDGHGGQNSGVHIAIDPDAPNRAPSVQAVKNEKGETVQRFTYYPPAEQNPKSVALAGTFN